LFIKQKKDVILQYGNKNIKTWLLIQKLQYNYTNIQINILLVHEDVKSVLIDRQTLKYKGGRVCPLPPPSAKPLYGGRALKWKTKIAEESDNRGGTNWRQFTQGIPVVDA
jgi:hypothetical protein